MKKRIGRSMMAIAAVAVVLSLASVPAAAQTSAAKPAGWNPPRTPDGQPDMQGIWAPAAANAAHSLEEGAEPENRRIQGNSEEQIARELATQPKVIVEPADGILPYRSDALAKRKEHLENLFTPTKWEHLEPEDRCLLEGVPRSNYRFTLQISQVPGYVVMVFEWNHAYRIIPIDGRPHLGENIKLWNGDSRGHWDGNTLVVDTTNQNDQTWFDVHGSYHSDALHVVERFTFANADTINYEATMEDPSVFTRPWKIAFPVTRNTQKGYELLEEACHEGEHNIERMLAVGRALKAAGVKGIHSHK